LALKKAIFKNKIEEN